MYEYSILLQFDYCLEKVGELHQPLACIVALSM
jgi:hypothetical protein